MSIRATRTPATSSRGGHLGPPSVRYEVSSPWPGIYGVFDARCTCTWAYGPGGHYQVKYVDAMCRGDHRGRQP